jgi:hypothetical protein
LARGETAITGSHCPSAIGVRGEGGERHQGGNIVAIRDPGAVSMTVLGLVLQSSPKHPYTSAEINRLYSESGKNCSLAPV